MSEINVELSILTRDFDAPMQLVYEAWTQENHLYKWQAPNAEIVCEYKSADIRVDGSTLTNYIDRVI
ncbi:hypothetical protein MNBD_GAMMA05-2451 [hydrothermal vent metagenome]|uniref:Uncharacterized protein n=1 Tax=hydrothermal vent metagenome TaxID=652676 RepID=A0A3B0XFM6_9ZZZZ